eukprot:TRINITY_DN1859_c0_g1_i5.p2 TRINITY_DN1859_c0_g1~~TRINITY_DN1859_c0_g1_i5.p2  ORF type:complete len:173 (+),score=3.10 TRINITY_DN1859_c0_g1_i5:245-763(+)
MCRLLGLHCGVFPMIGQQSFSIGGYPLHIRFLAPSPSHIYFLSANLPWGRPASVNGGNRFAPTTPVHIPTTRSNNANAPSAKMAGGDGQWAGRGGGARDRDDGRGRARVPHGHPRLGGAGVLLNTDVGVTMAPEGTDVLCSVVWVCGYVVATARPHLWAEKAVAGKPAHCHG